MHTLSIMLVSPHGLRLTWSVCFPERNTPNEHLGCKIAEEQANNLKPHLGYGPWTAYSSKWVS